MTRFTTFKHIHRHIQRRYAICVCCFVICSLCSFSKCVDTQHSTSATIMTENWEHLNFRELSWIGCSSIMRSGTALQHLVGPIHEVHVCSPTFFEGFETDMRRLYTYISTMWCVVSGKFVWHKLQHLNSLIPDCQLRICCHPALEFRFHHRGPEKRVPL